MINDEGGDRINFNVKAWVGRRAIVFFPPTTFPRCTPRYSIRSKGNGGWKTRMDANVRINFVVDTEREFARTLALNATTESNRISSDKGTDFLSCLFPRHDRVFTR